MHHLTAALFDGTAVHLLGFFHADGGIVRSGDMAAGAAFQQLFQIGPAAASAVQRLLEGRRPKGKPPVRQRPMAQIHGGDHDLPAETRGFAGVVEKRHFASSFVNWKWYEISFN